MHPGSGAEAKCVAKGGAPVKGNNARARKATKAYVPFPIPVVIDTTINRQEDKYDKGAFNR